MELPNHAPARLNARHLASSAATAGKLPAFEKLENAPPPVEM